MVGAGIPDYTNIVARVLGEMDAMLHNYVYDGYNALSSYLSVPLGVIAAIYIAIFGYAIMMGWVRVNMGNFVKAVLKIGFIYMAVTQWGWVSANVVGLVNGAIGGMGDALIAASPVHIPGVGGIDGAMQTTLIQFTNVGNTMFKMGGISNLPALFDGIVIWAFGYIIVAVALFEIILAKVMLAVLFVFIPLIVVFCYFKPFQSIFDKWLGAIVGFALLQLFVTAVLSLALSLCYWWVASATSATALGIGNVGTLPIIIIGVCCIGMIFKAADLAQNLGGIVSTSSGAAMVGGMIGGAIGSTMSGLSIGKKGVGAAGGALGAAGGVFGAAGKDLGGGLAAAGSQAAQGAMSGLKAVAGDTKNWLKHTLRKGDFE